MNTTVPLSISLIYIANGWISFAVEAEGRRIVLAMDNLEDEEVQLVHFIQVLAAGGFPRAATAGLANSHFTVTPLTEAGCCRFVVSARSEDIVQTIDVITSRDELVTALIGLAATIGNHPCYVHEYLLHGTHPGEEYDMALDGAEAEWQAEIREGRLVGDADGNAETDFVARRMSATLTLPQERMAWAEEYRNMLRTLRIPEKWLSRSGLTVG
jgi:hypothetical protein